jgi:metal-dependent amidase/aminoacylase/carboxypeptidase family protein
VGRIAAEPGASNVIPGRVDLSLELRDLSMDKIAMLYERIVERARIIEAESGSHPDSALTELRRWGPYERQPSQRLPASRYNRAASSRAGG